VINPVVPRLLCDVSKISCGLILLVFLFCVVCISATPDLLADEPANDLPALGAKAEDLQNPDAAEKPSLGADATASGEKDEPAPKPSLLGDPLAPGKLQLLKQEIMSGLVKRQITDNFSRFRSYTGFKLSSSAGRYTGSELTGNCRISWYDHLLRNHLDAPVEAERFTRDLHKAALSNQEGLSEIIAIAAKKMDLGQRRPREFTKAESPQQALEIVKQSIADAQVAYAAALATLTKSQIRELQTYIYPVLVGDNQVGHTLNDRGTGRRLCDLM
jgi:hypothetical protein